MTDLESTLSSFKFDVFYFDHFGLSVEFGLKNIAKGKYANKYTIKYKLTNNERVNDAEHDDCTSHWWRSRFGWI